MAEGGGYTGGGGRLGAEFELLEEAANVALTALPVGESADTTSLLQWIPREGVWECGDGLELGG